MTKKQILISIFTGFLLAGTFVADANSSSESNKGLDETLQKLLQLNDVHPMDKPDTDPDKVELGRLLFWDKILSGNKNISCATCHLPQAATADALPLSIGQGGVGVMMSRVPPKDEGNEPVFVPRNATDLFNRAEFVTMFWDGRVMTRKGGAFFAPVGGSESRKNLDMWTPAAFALPKGLDGALAAQAMFPPTSDTEMRGNFHENHLGSFKRWDWDKIWPGLVNRLLEINEYRKLFNKAYPDISYETISFVHAANAIAAFEIEAFTLVDAPFDQYLRGNSEALTLSEKRGALLFYGEAGCARCHSGKLMTDQIFHNRAVPQIGPGKGDLPAGGIDGTWDAGRGGVTGFTQYFYAFRTPPLRNVEKTGPWMHDGVFSTLEATVRHELDPIKSAKNYDPYKQLPDQFAITFRPKQMETITSFALQNPEEIAPIALNDLEFKDLISFLKALTSPSLDTLVELVPKSVPSGLVVED